MIGNRKKYQFTLSVIRFFCIVDLFVMSFSQNKVSSLTEINAAELKKFFINRSGTVRANRR